MGNASDPLNADNAQFQSTRWSVVLAAKNAASSTARDALADLCGLYWYPLFTYIRRNGYNAEQAQDLTQGFFLSLLQHDFLKNVEHHRGRFRHYLLAACKNYLAMYHRSNNAQKRGGQLIHLSLDFEKAELRYQQEPTYQITADQLFEYRWALTLIDQVFDRLRQKCQSEGKGEWFAQLQGHLDGNQGDSYQKTADRLGMTEGAVKVAVHRLRQQFGQLLREEIAQTVANPDEVEEEIRSVFRSLALND